MRVLMVFGVAALLLACSSAKDYSSAARLTDIETRLSVKERWVFKTEQLPKDAHAQMPPAVANGKVFVANASGRVDVLDEQTGKLAWSVELKDALTGGPGAGAGLIFVGTREAEIIALSQQDGSEQWRSRISGEMLATPQVAGNLLIVQTIDGKLSALDVKTGKRLWDHGRDIPPLTLRGTSIPLVIGEHVIAGFADGKLVSLALKTGELQWEATIAVPVGRTDLERLVDIDGILYEQKGVVYVSSFQGRIAAVDVNSGNILWAREMSSYVGVAASHNQVYVVDAEGLVWALDGHSGATLWRQDNLKGREVSSPVVIDDALVVGDYDGFVHWLSTSDGQFIARQDLSDIWARHYLIWGEEYGITLPRRSVTAAPILVGNAIYLRDNAGALVALQWQPVTN